MTEEKIISRIQKMLAIANDARANEGERDNALRMAHNLLAKHNLELGDVEARARDQQDPRIKNTLDSWSQAWAKSVFQASAKLFFCSYYFGRKINATKCVHNFVGRTSNATTAALMGEYLVTSILRECRRNWVHNLAPESRSFALGAAAAIYRRVEELRKADLPDAAPGTALVLADIAKVEDDENEAFIRAAGTSLTVKKTRASPVDPEAYAAGVQYGKKVNLSTQVGGTTAALRIK
jgi:Protein of unknown function (DUF2786)